MKNKQYLYKISPTFLDIFKDNFDVSVYQNLHEKRIRAGKNLLSDFYKYFFSSLHDSSIISVDFDNNFLSIKINDIVVTSFFDALKENDIELSKENKEFPLKIIFEKIKNIDLYHINNNLLLKPMKFYFLSEIETLLYYELININLDEISIAFLFWIKNSFYKNNYMLMVVNASNISILEMQDKKWKEYTNNRYSKLYNEFKKERFSGTYFDYSTSLKFIKKIYI